MINEGRSVGTNDATHDDQRDTSTYRTAHKEHPTTDFIDEDQRRKCTQTIDDAIHASCEERCCVSAET